uniref:Uncharacterized protein n=1 Tax=Setaria viridis TaxID=4556 RepID=A0A4U6U807_SETVI|nr:hypothetical protein SEVIR_6G131600v2 [Setaria viridis]
MTIKKEAKNPSAPGTSTAELPSLGGPQAGQTPYHVPQQNQYSADYAPAHIGIMQTPLQDAGNGCTPKTSQPPYEPEKRNNSTSKKHAANGMSRGVKY